MTQPPIASPNIPNPMEIIHENFEPWYLKLTIYARNLIRRRVWQGKFGGEPANGEEPEDIVVRVFTKLVSGERTWDSQRFPQLLPVLFKMVKSEIWNLKVSSDNDNFKQPFFEENGQINFKIEDVFVNLSSNPLTEVQLQEIERFSGEILSFLISSVGDNPELTLFLELFLDDQKPADIASRMKNSDKQILALRKQIDRRLRKIIEENYSFLIPDENGR